MESMHAVRVAMRVLALPMAGRNHAVAPMPPHVLEVLRIAARSPDTLQQWSNELRMPPDRLVDAANAFIQEVMMPPHANHYRVLGVEPDASMALIRTHYRWLAQGLQAGDAVANGWMLDRANVAFEELSDPLRRSAYDETLGGSRTNDYDDAEDFERAPTPTAMQAPASAEPADEDDTVEILALKPEEAGVDPDHWPDETGKFQYVPPEPEPVYPQPRNWVVPAGLAAGIAAGVVLIIFILNPKPDLPPEPLAATEEALAEFETSLPNATYDPEAGGLPVFDPLPELPPETEPVAQAPVTPAPRPRPEARPSPPPAQVAARPAPRQEPPPVASRPQPVAPPVQAQPEPEPVVQAPPPAPVLDPAALARSARPLVERFRDAWTAGDFLTVMNVLGDGGEMGAAALAPIAGDVQRWRRERPGQSLDITGLALVNTDDPASPRMVATLSTADGAGMRLSLRQVNGLWRATGLVRLGAAAGGPSS